MTQTATQQPPPPPPLLTTVADVTRPPLTTADTGDQAAAAAYLMKHARATALIVLRRADRPARAEPGNLGRAIARRRQRWQPRVFGRETASER
jgi:hypothetical protein